MANENLRHQDSQVAARLDRCRVLEMQRLWAIEEGEMKASEIPALREKLTRACDEKIAEGWEIVSGPRIYSYTVWMGGEEVGRVWKFDPLGAATGETDITKAAKKLGIRKEDALRLSIGFSGLGVWCGHPLSGSTPLSRAGQLGLELRRKYIKGGDTEGGSGTLWRKFSKKELNQK
jgi:hypothetical protein